MGDPADKYLTLQGTDVNTEVGLMRHNTLAPVSKGSMVTAKVWNGRVVSVSTRISGASAATFCSASSNRDGARKSSIGYQPTFGGSSRK
ncbi:MAG: hypothetical protein ACLQVD_01280 [Capsulimonadaceae bacterium]